MTEPGTDSAGGPAVPRPIPPIPLPPGHPVPSYQKDHLAYAPPALREAAAEPEGRPEVETDGQGAGKTDPGDGRGDDASGAPQRTAHLETGWWVPAAEVRATPADDGHRPAGARRGLVPLLLVGALALGAVGGVTGPLVVDALGGGPGSVTLPSVQADPGLTRPDGSIADIAATVGPSVVSIRVAGADGQGTGSGFVIREDGYILTNNHVIAAAVPSGRISVTFADGSETEATLVGRTADYDLAVIEVDLDGLVPLVLGDSESVVVGDPVIAIGAPLGLDGTVTSGIISALNRPVSAGDTGAPAFINALQTDAAINPGNSGGPLVNGSGEVIGINSAIAQPPGQVAASGSIGLGFAIGSTQAKRTAEEIIATGSASYPIIGVLLDGAYDGEGVQVVQDGADGQEPVTPDGPADGAGIEPGDVILSIDGRPVTQSDELIVAIRAKAPGDTVVLRVRSGGDERDVSMVLDKATSE
ncbi:S1C family serine protease [Sanguibacter suaedae]|uniref:Trypsin-like peptidase domain-containing protein n=1 Tax=Sanguibacter suaedae TaxID=2795737 RepID=A0A934I404_9MICO|nr:trypsin-like peptidase domain-containing protein [Sanguibacter suaedae]MBI9115174.1 trypsin-like peptidase domain-containing protein [Sanguibacter suaedae]